MTEHPRPFVSHDPAMKGGSATLNNTRLTVEAVAAFIWDGYPEDDIRRLGWEYLSRHDMLVVAWFLGTHGSRTWRKRWGAWAKDAHRWLNAATSIDACPWPPSVFDSIAIVRRVED